jgi:hypothetical protein
VGTTVGIPDGCPDGSAEGTIDGILEGRLDGTEVTGDCVGSLEVGTAEGAPVSSKNTTSAHLKPICSTVPHTKVKFLLETKFTHTPASSVKE